MLMVSGGDSFGGFAAPVSATTGTGEFFLQVSTNLTDLLSNQMISADFQLQTLVDLGILEQLNQHQLPILEDSQRQSLLVNLICSDSC